MKYSKIMVRDKRAVSGVVTTLIIIAIALAALGIAWGFIDKLTRDVVKSGEDESSDLIEDITGTNACVSEEGTCVEGTISTALTDQAEIDAAGNAICEASTTGSIWIDEENLDAACGTDKICCA